MRWFAAPILLLVLAGAALAWDLADTLPASTVECARESGALVPQVHAPEEVRWVDVAFFLVNESNESMLHKTPGFVLRIYEQKAFGRLALVHESVQPDHSEPGFEGFEVPPGERAWMGGTLFEPAPGTERTRDHVARYEGGGHCATVRFSPATAGSAF